MPLVHLIPFTAALLCLEVAAIFAGIYWKVSRRKTDLAFSGMAFSLAMMTSGSFVHGWAGSWPGKLAGLRFEWVGVFLSVTLFLLFVSLVRGETPRAATLALMGLMAVAWVAMSRTEWFLHLPPLNTPVRTFATAAQGPAYRYLVPVPLALASVAWLHLILGGRRATESGFSPLGAHLPLVLAGGLPVILMGTLIVFCVMTGRALPLSPHSLAAALFCIFVAAALGQEVYRADQEKTRLAQLAEFRTQAVRDVAHELKNPLAAIQMAAATALDSIQRGDDPQMIAEMMQMSVEDCQRLTRLINNMLDTARLEAGRKVDLRVEPTDLPRLVDSVLARQRTTTASHRIELHSELPDPVVRLDPDKVHQVMTNLVNNAIKYSPDGGEVRVQLRPADGEVRIGVADQGIGMTPEQQARLFQRFERVVDPTRKITGTGIGLHLVKQLVEAHGGRIWVESEYGKGSTFHVALPATA